MIRNKIIRIAICISGIVCMILGIRMIIGGPMEYIKQREQVEWPEINAVIVDVSSRVERSGSVKHSRSTTYYDFIIEYEVAGKVYTNESRSHTKIRQVGDSITVKYDPNAPETFTTALAPSIMEMLLLMAFGAIFSTIGFFVSGAFALIQKWRRRGMPEEKEELPPEEYVDPKTVADERTTRFPRSMQRLLFVVASLVIIFVSIKFFPGKQSVTTDQFQSAAESKGYVTVDTTEKRRQDWRVGSMLEEAVSVDNGTVRIDFCVMDTRPSAQQLYYSMNLPITDGKVKESSGSLHELYSVETDSVYVAKIRVTDTIIYVWTPIEQKENVVDFLDSIGYWKD
ncbi:MAG: DUF3592 domain-containing protein [Bacteroidaceae bacterium]|nr:DUF3592 domain-containing protein [Bacteroidaceae bacterium]